MDAALLMQTLIEFGADEKGIKDRFAGNDELYEMCFNEFLTEPNFELLDSAMKFGDYDNAFNASHALKGLSGNLGLTAFYEAICVLVESLRSKNFKNLNDEYKEVIHQFEKLKLLVSGESPKAEVARKDDKNKHIQSKDKKGKNHPRRRLIELSILSVCVLFGVSILFCRIGINFRKNLTQESAATLSEMGNQTRIYIEERIANDWKTAISVSNSVINGNYNDDSDVSRMLKGNRMLWQVSDILLYTENGLCIDSDGITIEYDKEKMSHSGKNIYFSYSEIIYNVPVDTQLNYYGSRVVAVSVVRNISGFLNNIKFSTLGNNSKIYFTMHDGTVIGALPNNAENKVKNFKSIVKGYSVEQISKDKVSTDLFSVPQSTAFIIKNNKESNYITAVQIKTDGEPMHFFFVAPQADFNKTMDGFSHILIVLSIVIILIFTAFTLVIFLIIFHNRKKLFDKQLRTRMKMYDLLTSNARIAFGIFSVDKKSPDFVSNNTADIVGSKFLMIERDGDSFKFIGSGDIAADSLTKANEMLKGWDGNSVFKSGYLINEHTMPPNYFEFELYPVNDSKKDFVAIARDASEAFRREEATKAALEMAERSNKAKSHFLSNMSHDIRTPMNAIMNMTAFALESINNPKKLREYLRIINQSSEHLLQLINDVLDMSRIESGQVLVSNDPFNINDEIIRLVNIIRPLCEEKSLTLITNFEGIHTHNICGDKLKFSQIIINLLSNAMKFTPANGAIRFTAEEVYSLRDDMVDLRITVEDNGIGISEENIERIFEPFNRANDKRINKIEGTGLGLSICKSYVTAMGGTIGCESEEGEGSIFTVELFFKKADALSSKENTISDFDSDIFYGLHCLVAEDNYTNQVIAKTLLQRMGFIVDIADDGGKCVQHFVKSIAGTYDVIYMDIQMPVMDGYQAAVAIRDSEHPQARTIPIIAMSANVFAEDIEKARISGMDGYIGKPIMSFNLIEETTKALEKRKELRQ